MSGWRVVGGIVAVLFLGGPVQAELIKRDDSKASQEKKEEATADCDCEAEEEEEEEKSPWSGSLAFGMSASVGEDEVATLSADFNSVYDARPHRVEFLLNGFYSVENGDNNANRQLGQTEYRYYFLPKWYAFGTTSAERNLQQDLRFRSTTNLGPGYQVLERDRPNARIVKKDSASLQLGAGYQYQRLSSAGEKVVDQNFVLQATATYSLTLVHNITWDTRTSFTVPPGDLDLWRFLGDTTLNVPIIGTLGVQARLTLDYLNGPLLESRGGRKLTFFGSLGVSYSY